MLFHLLGNRLVAGFAVYHLREPDDTQLPLTKEFFAYNACCARSPAFINKREISGRYKFVPGTYVFVPSTFDPHEEGDFLLRIFAEKMPKVKQIS